MIYRYSLMHNVFFPFGITLVLGNSAGTKILLPQILYKHNGEVGEGGGSLYSWQFTI